MHNVAVDTCRDEVLVPLVHAMAVCGTSECKDAALNLMIDVCGIPKSMPHIMMLLCTASAAAAPGATDGEKVVNLMTSSS